MSTTQPNPVPDDRRRVRISEPGDLIAAIPAMLGFVPHRSLVALCLGGTPTAVQCVMRCDLPGPLVTDVDEHVLDRIAEVCRQADVDSVIAVVVDDRDHRPGTEPLVAALAESLADLGVVLAAAHATDGIVAGGPWWSLLDDPRVGVLPDPRASEVAVAQVFRGRIIRGSRDELAALLAPDHDRGSRRLARRLALARHPSSPAGTDGELLESVLTRIAFLDATGHLDDEDAVRVAAALDRVAVRDAALGLALTVAADAAERMWLELARILPGRARAEPAVLLGFSAYVRGDGPLAGVALDAALDADPEHRLASMLDAALAHGVQPDRIADLADTGQEIASALGVVLPPAEEGWDAR